jgi:hypothetical protein
MATGTISSLFRLTHHIITQTQYTMLVTVVTLSAVVPTLIGQAFFRPPPPSPARRSQPVSGPGDTTSGTVREVPSGLAPNRPLSDTET